MPFDINGWEFIVLLLLALFIFGPERLPKIISDTMRVIRQLREMARNATDDISREIGHDVKIEDLNPKTFVRKHLLSEEDQATLRRPFEDAYRDVKDVANQANGAASNISAKRPAKPPTPRDALGSDAPRSYDADAT